MAFLQYEQGRTYTRYGGREDHDAESHLNKNSLLRVTRQVLTLHEDKKVHPDNRYRANTKTVRTHSAHEEDDVGEKRELHPLPRCEGRDAARSISLTHETASCPVQADVRAHDTPTRGCSGGARSAGPWCRQFDFVTTAVSYTARSCAKRKLRSGGPTSCTLAIRELHEVDLTSAVAEASISSEGVRLMSRMRGAVSR